MTNYRLDPVTRVWHRPDVNSIAYSDGEEAEQYLLSVLRSARDVSSTSSELLDAIRDWPSEYHLSPLRHNLLRPFPFGPGDRVLELGCGCGALTRYLGETGATVVAVEGSPRRAEIAAERCRDLPNVRIVRDNIADFTMEERFDHATLIGVLEYAPRFIPATDPVAACLEKVRALLRDQGTLLLAIENRLGLKYFNGCAEDHVGIPYFGIQGLYDPTSPVTFGQVELSQRLSAAGFPEQAFYYPFPDYKLPGLILSEQGTRTDRVNIADLLLPYNARDYQERHHRAFDESLVWQGIHDNGLMGSLANAFLVSASRQSVTPPAWFAKSYGRTLRHPAFRMETTLTGDARGEVMVTKHPLHPRFPCPPADLFIHTPQDEPCHPGRLLMGEIHRAFARGRTLEDIAAPFLPWLAYLRRHATPDTDGCSTLPEDFVDCVPANLLMGENGEPHYFDREWCMASRPPLAWIVIRGLMYAPNGRLANGVLEGMSHREFVTAVAERGGIHLSEEDFTRANELESRFFAHCHGKPPASSRLAALQDEKLFLLGQLSDAPTLRARLHWCSQELARIKATRSWRFTGPFRALWNLLRRASPGE